MTTEFSYFRIGTSLYLVHIFGEGSRRTVTSKFGRNDNSPEISLILKLLPRSIYSPSQTKTSFERGKEGNIRNVNEISTDLVQKLEHLRETMCNLD